MSQLVIRALVLAAIYLLVLTSVEPGDVVIALVLGFAAAYALRPATDGGPRPTPAATLRELRATVLELVRGSWQVARFCLGRRSSPGFVEIPRDGRSPRAVARWTILTAIAPGEVVVDVESGDDPDVMLIHAIEARDPEAIRRRHRREVEPDA